MAILPLTECRALWGGMDVTPLAKRIDAGSEGIAGRMISAHHVRVDDVDSMIPLDHMTGWPADLVYQFDPGPDPGALVLDVGTTRTPLAIGWRDRGQDWLIERSARFQPTQAGTWRFDLKRWPHWAGSEAGRIDEFRIRFVSPPLAMGPPGLVVP